MFHAHASKPIACRTALRATLLPFSALSLFELAPPAALRHPFCASWYAQVAQCKLLCASSAALRKLLYASSARVSTQAALRGLVCASCSTQVAPRKWPAQVASCSAQAASLCKLLCASCSTQVALRKFHLQVFGTRVAQSDALFLRAQVAILQLELQERISRFVLSSSSCGSVFRCYFRIEVLRFLLRSLTRGESNQDPRKSAQAARQLSKLIRWRHSCASTTPIPAEGRARAPDPPEGCGRPAKSNKSAFAHRCGGSESPQ